MLIRFSLLIVLLFSTITNGQLVKFEPIQNYNKTGRVVYDDIMSHSIQNQKYDGISVNAHEYSHDASNKLYLKEHGGETYRYLYVLDNYGFKFKIPRNFKLLQLANKIPKEYRDENFNLYMIVQSQKYFNDDSISILDEWNAYTIGTMASIEANEDEFKIQDTGWRMLELGIYSLYVQKAANQKDINEFVKLQIKRQDFICNKVKMSEHMKKNQIIFKQLSEKNK